MMAGPGVGLPACARSALPVRVDSAQYVARPASRATEAQCRPAACRTNARNEVRRADRAQIPAVLAADEQAEAIFYEVAQGFAAAIGHCSPIVLIQATMAIGSRFGKRPA